MQQKNILISSLKEALAMIWKNKPLFLLLFVLQIIFFAAFFFATYKYIPKIIQSVQSITSYLDRQNLDEASVTASIMQKKSILGDDPLSISRNFSEIVGNFRIYLIYVFVLLIFFISVGWTATNRMIHKDNYRKLLKYFLKILIVLLFCLGLIFSFFFSLIGISFTQIAAEAAKFYTKYIPFLIFSAILAYFMFVSLALANKTGLKNIVQKTLSIGIRKARYIISVYLINAFLFTGSAVLSFYFIESNLFVLMSSLILMIFSFIFGRIFMVNVVGKLD